MLIERSLSGKRRTSGEDSALFPEEHIQDKEKWLTKGSEYASSGES